MGKKSRAKAALPFHLNKGLEVLGQNLRIARKRRRMTQDELAKRMMCSLPTIGRLESGDPGISLGLLAQAMWVLGLSEQIVQLASPESDTVGIQNDTANLPQRIRKTKTEEKKLDF